MERAQPPTSAVDLYWIPLGAGGHSVRFNGKVYEARRRADRPPAELRHLPHSADRAGPRRAVHNRDDTRPEQRALGTRRRGGRSRRHPMGRPVPHLPIRSSPLARRHRPRHRVRGGEPDPANGERRPRPRHPRTAADRAHRGAGTRRTRRRRDVELQLDHLLGAHPRRRRDRRDPPPSGRESTRLGRRHRRRPTIRNSSTPHRRLTRRTRRQVMTSENGPFAPTRRTTSARH